MPEWEADVASLGCVGSSSTATSIDEKQDADVKMSGILRPYKQGALGVFLWLGRACSGRLVNNPEVKGE